MIIIMDRGAIDIFATFIRRVSCHPIGREDGNFHIVECLSVDNQRRRGV
ncbi:hypothetical protein B0G76_3893 [Paraburkholderia sp. BL23I1N1]|nr:hypothetical protein B0G76_3893 [Paraburkholderia sp. BL23I1N1]